MLGRVALLQVLGLGQACVPETYPNSLCCVSRVRWRWLFGAGWQKNEAPWTCLQSFTASYMEPSVGFEVCPGLESFLLCCRNYLILFQGFYFALGHLVPGKRHTHPSYLQQTLNSTNSGHLPTHYAVRMYFPINKAKYLLTIFHLASVNKNLPPHRDKFLRFTHPMVTSPPSAPFFFS